MKNVRNVIKVLLSIITGFFIITGCASMFMKGGALAPKNYKPVKEIVAYRAEGTVPAGVQYFLVETDKGPAIFERSDADGSGALFLTRWKDDQGIHFAGWVAKSHGYEFIIPTDKNKEGKKYVYPVGTYRIKKIDGIERPVPNDPSIEPVARLIPK
jgi:hypothetical protein